ncbi:MAG: thioredoxin-disulfide reductase [Deltaproteobacteria bacterium]|nr:MAG: thioredoxin-disulfide reductase [Deltaproteobacteria bacterium]
MNDDRIRDLVIIGGGPAGLAAGIYAARARLDTLLIEKLGQGGQILLTDWIENYPGFPDGVSGFELADLFGKQATKFGLEILNGEVLGLKLEGKTKIIDLGNQSIRCKSIIIATGASPSRLGVEGEDSFTGKGVSFCATCDGPFYREKVVAVVGGGNSAVEEALFLTKFASKVYIIHRRDELRATKILQERAFNNPKIEIIWDTVVVKIEGDDAGVNNLKIKNVKTEEISDLSVDGVFIFVGTIPNTSYVPQEIEKNSRGFLITNENMETSVPGIFAAGDVRAKLLRQIVTAVGDGATAAFAAELYIQNEYQP